jgi:hypothetical protein
MQASRETSKRAFDILENSHDNREKLQAMELFKDTHIVKLGLLSNATTLDSALNYIRNKQQGECSKGRYRPNYNNYNKPSLLLIMPTLITVYR